MNQRVAWMVSLSYACIGVAMGQEFLPRSDVLQYLQSDAKLVAAIRQAEVSFADFLEVLNQPAAQQSGFMVTVLQREPQQLIPYGILEPEIVGSQITGKLVSNLRRPTPVAEVSCTLDHFVDWRYIDTYECEGGLLYKELFRRQRARDQGEFERIVLCYFSRERHNSILPDPKIDANLHRLFRDIANLRYQRVEDCLVANPQLIRETGTMPFPYVFISKQLAWIPVYSGQVGAMYGDRKMLMILRKWGALEPVEGMDPPLIVASQVGNHEAVKALCEWGHDPNVKDKDGDPCLNVALRGLADEKLVSALLQFGADINRVNDDNRSAIFFVRSIPMAELLLQFQPNLQLISSRGENCVQSHLSLGRTAVAAFLVKNGAPREDFPDRFLDEFNLEGGKVALLEYVREHESEEEYQSLQAFFDLNYGFVLPVESLPILSKQP